MIKNGIKSFQKPQQRQKRERVTQSLILLSITRSNPMRKCPMLKFQDEFIVIMTQIEERRDPFYGIAQFKEVVGMN